ncbi:MAG: hypothetical protein RhofKO_40220 [Rhodothermales bacterium]
MASSARLGTFQDLIALIPHTASTDVLAILHTLRTVVLADLPEAVEVVRLGDRAASYGIGPKKMSESHVYLQPQKDRVNLGFWHGVHLPDPEGLLEGTGKKLRHVKVRSVEAAEAPAVRALVAAALAERRNALGR